MFLPCSVVSNLVNVSTEPLVEAVHSLFDLVEVDIGLADADDCGRAGT